MTTGVQTVYQRHRLTVAEYHRMGQAGVFSEDDRVELIEGDIVDMAPIGSSHAGTVKYLINILKLAVGERAIVSAQDPLALDRNSEPQPDIALLKPRTDFYRTAHPQPEDVLLLVEVADTTLRYDREVKLPLYARHNIPEVWIVDLENRGLCVYREPAEAGYRNAQTVEHPGVLVPVTLPDIPIDLSGLFSPPTP